MRDIVDGRVEVPIEANINLLSLLNMNIEKFTHSYMYNNNQPRL